METYPTRALDTSADSPPRTDTPTAQSKHGGAKVGFPPPLVFLSLVGTGLALQHFLLPFTLPSAAGLRAVVGVLVAMTGVASVLAARVQFFRTGQSPMPWTPSPELLANGIYKYTRNPMYLGVTLFQLGLGVALGNGWIASLSPFALLVVHFLAVVPEERYLQEKFGESYRRYKAAVRRYL